MPSSTVRRRLSVSTALVERAREQDLHLRLDSSGGVFTPFGGAGIARAAAASIGLVRHGAHASRHAELADHPSRKSGCALEIVCRAGGEFSEREVLGCAAAQQNRKPIHQLVFLKKISIFGRLLHVSQRREAARNDRHLVHGLGGRRELGDDRVAGLVKRDDAALLCVRESILPLEADDNAIDGRMQFGHADFGFLAARRQQGGFVENVLEIGAHHAGRTARHVFEIDVARELHLARVHLKDGVASSAVGPVDEHLAVEAAGTQQGGYPGSRAGWLRRSRRCRRASRTRPSRRAADSASARARRFRRLRFHRNGSCRWHRARR